MSTIDPDPIQASHIGPYRLGRELGRGGMGVVYEAIQEPIARRVAVKILLPEHTKKTDVLTRFFHEARIVNLIDHPNIVQISDCGQASDGTAFLVMEFLPGETLEARMSRCQAQSEQISLIESLQLVIQVAAALAAAHEKNIIHRDLKPANIMLMPDPLTVGGTRVKVLDFGIAKLVEGQGLLTATNIVMGTPRYMSPEQWQGSKNVDEKTDVYALGIILYELCSGGPLFSADNPIDLMAHHAFSAPPPLHQRSPAVPVELTRLVQRLLAKKKSERPPMREVVDELSRILTSCCAGTRERQAVGWLARPSTQVGALLAGAGLVAAGVMMLWLPLERPRQPAPSSAIPAAQSSEAQSPLAPAAAAVTEVEPSAVPAPSPAPAVKRPSRKRPTSLPSPGHPFPEVQRED